MTAGIKRAVRRLLAGETPNLRRTRLDMLGLVVQRERPLQFADRCRELGIET